MHQNDLLKHKEELEEVIERLPIIRVGRDFSTLICPWNAVVAFIDEMEKMQFHIAGFEWWCHVTQGHEPCGLGGPRDRCGNGWYSELPIDTFLMLESNAAYRHFFTVEVPNRKDYKPCFVPAFCLETLQAKTCKGGIRMKKVYFIISIVALITCLTGIPDLVEGITARGWGGVNYGRIIFPFLIGSISFWLFKRKK